MTAYLYVFTGVTGDLPTEAKTIFGQVMTGVTYTVDKDQAVTLTDGTAAWWSLPPPP